MYRLAIVRGGFRKPMSGKKTKNNRARSTSHWTIIYYTWRKYVLFTDKPMTCVGVVTHLAYPIAID
jgi:hypothetical protein